MTLVTVMLTAFAIAATDYDEMAINDLVEAADVGDAESQYKLGKCYLYGTGVNKNREKAKDLLKYAARCDKNAKKLYGEEFQNKAQELN